MKESKFEQREKPHIGELVVATGNPAKLERYRRGLTEHFDVKISSLRDESLEKVEEPFDTAEENARHKALEYFRQCGKPVLAVDEALYVDFLPADRQPGVHVRRFGGGEELSDEVLLSRVRDLVEAAPAEKRTGRFHFAICLARSEKDLIEINYDSPKRFSAHPSEKFRVGYPLGRMTITPGFDKPDSELDDIEYLRADKPLMEKVAAAIRLAWNIG